MQTIQLSHKLIISNKEEAIRYQLERLYNDYFKQLDTQLEFLGVSNGVGLTMQIELNTILQNTFLRQFTVALDQTKPFVDLNDVPLEIESIRLICKTFTKNAPDPRLFIFLESKPMQVVESYNSTKVLKNPYTADGNPLLSVELDKTTTLVSIQE